MSGDVDSGLFIREKPVANPWFRENILRALRIGFEFFLQTCLAPQSIDGLVFGCLDDPGARRFGNAVSAPLIDGRGESFLGGVFGKFKITKLAYESCNNATPVRPIHCVNGNIGVRKHV